MITKVSFRVSFPAGAVFHDNPWMLLYRDIMKYIRKLSCFNTDKKCRTCPESGFCKFYKASGENFTRYPAILLHSPVFYKQVIGVGEDVFLEFFFIGSVISCLPFLELFFQNTSHLHGIPMILKSQQKEELDSDLVTLHKIRIITPIETDNPEKVISAMIDYWNTEYQAKVPVSISCSVLQNAVRTSLPAFRGSAKGFTGYVYSMTIPRCLTETGIGKWICIGGGQIET